MPKPSWPPSPVRQPKTVWTRTSRCFVVAASLRTVSEYCNNDQLAICVSDNTVQGNGALLSSPDQNETRMKGLLKEREVVIVRDFHTCLRSPVSPTLRRAIARSHRHRQPLQGLTRYNSTKIVRSKALNHQPRVSIGHQVSSERKFIRNHNTTTTSINV